MSETTNGCVKIRSLLEGYFEGALRRKQERLVAEHLWQCPSCAADLEQIRRLALALESLPALEPASDLLAAISARLDTLPAPREGRRTSIGWLRLGETAGLAMAALAALLYALGGTSHLSEGRLAHYAGLTAAVAANWLAWGSHTWTLVVPAVRGLLVALTDLLRAAAPTVGIYGAAELMLVVAVALTLQRARFDRPVSSGIGVRRS